MLQLFLNLIKMKVFEFIIDYLFESYLIVNQNEF